METTHLSTGRAYTAIRIAVVAALVPIVSLFCYVFVGLEDPVYPFDYGTYWQMYKTYGVIISNNTQWWRSVLSEISSKDYNPSSVVPLYPFYLAFGGSRVSYITAVSVLYLLPTAAIAASVATWSLAKRQLSVWIAAFALAITYLPFWTPTLLGMIDIVGLIFLGLSTLVLFRSEFLRSKALLTPVLLGVLLWTPFLLRKWYAFSVVSFFVAAFAIGLLLRWREGIRDWRDYALFIARLAVSGLVLIALIWIFQADFALRMLNPSSYVAFDAYQTTLNRHLFLAYSRLGIYTIILIATGAIYYILKRNYFIIFCVITSAITYSLFISTQIISNHHFLPIAFMLFPVYFAGASVLSSALLFLPSSYRMVPACFLALVIFLFGVAPTLPSIPGISFFVPRITARPMKLENFPEYMRLAHDLEKTTGTIAVHASSLVLADRVLTAVDPDLGSRILATPHLASDGLVNFQMFQADYAIAPIPPQVHMAPGTQEHIVIPGQLLIDRQGFGKAYEQVGDAYRLAQGVQAFLFRRNREVTPAEVADLVERLGSAYPGWRERFLTSLDPFLAFMKTEPGDMAGNVAPRPNNILFVHPGMNTPTRVILPMSIATPGPRLAKITLSIDASVLKSCPDADGADFSLDIDGVQTKSGHVRAGESVTEILPSSGNLLTLTVDKAGTASCDHVYAAFSF